jgi:DNA-binding GntR family transcriptional regulator
MNASKANWDIRQPCVLQLSRWTGDVSRLFSLRTEVGLRFHRLGDLGMNEKIAAFLKALKDEDHESARRLLPDAMKEAESQPDEFVSEKGKPPKFYRKGKRVELSPDGKWVPLKKSK